MSRNSSIANVAVKLFEIKLIESLKWTSDVLAASDWPERELIGK